MLNSRLRVIKETQLKKEAVIYWMSRDQRVNDNFALLYGQKLALEKKLPLIVIFIFQKKFLQAAWRQYFFMIQGLKQVVDDLKKLNIDFYLLEGKPTLKETFQELIAQRGIFDLVTDFSPLRIKKNWLNEIKKLPISIYEVDTHNIIPYHKVSDKKEFAAFTFRKKASLLLNQYLKEPEKVVHHPFDNKVAIKNINFVLEKDINQVKKFLDIDFCILPTTKFKPGKEAALKTLDQFIKEKLPFYAIKRNELYPSYQSDLSPYLHFGQISSLRIALDIKEASVKEINKKVFLEELIIRKELADNFCYYEENYDNFAGIPLWAKKTLLKHKGDKKNLYDINDLENAKTNDELWNAAQKEMVKTGKMHGYLRMYWAKKILEWSLLPEEAIKIAVYLNDKYELDGRDPKGYVGILWSIGGVHDRPFFERPIYGLIRTMSKKSIEKRFNVKGYLTYVSSL